MTNYSVKHRGQSLIEYALILVLIAVAVLVVASNMGTATRDALRRLSMFGDDDTPPILNLKDDFLDRIQAYHDTHGRWPRSWGDHRFVDLGLDPDDWREPVEGISWNPHGSEIGLGNEPGDDLQIYVNDLAGNPRHLYDGWNIWCPAGDANCYYHTVAPGNEVDLTTLIVVEE